MIKLFKSSLVSLATIVACLPVLMSAQEVIYLHPDHLGGPTVITDPLGSLTELTEFYPTGGVRLSQPGTVEKRKFTGHRYDPDTELTFAEARYYEGEGGRFLSQDPAFQQVTDSRQLTEKTGLSLEQYLSDPQHLNSYSYVKNNPLKYVDKTGEFLLDVVSLGFSINDYRNSPTFTNAALVGLDAVGLAVPGIPAVAGMVRPARLIISANSLVQRTGLFSL